MITYEDSNGWVQKETIITMHTHDGMKYSKGMLRNLLKETKELESAMTHIPSELLNFWKKHYNCTLIDEKTQLFRVTRRNNGSS